MTGGEGEICDLPFTINGYEFVKFIGRGTYSLVFEVRSLKYGQEFCAKVTGIDADCLDEKGRVVYDAELLCLQSLDHPNILRLYDFFVHESNLILILERCEGGTLMDVIEDRENMWTIIRLRGLMMNTLQGLLCCTHHNIAHRDIKPSNIMIDHYQRAKVGDFGLSHYAAKSELTTVRCGSGNYAAPEIFSSEMYDPYAADIWSLGVTFFQLVFKRLPWPEDTEPEKRQITDDSFPSDADPCFAKMIKEMLDRDPSKRPAIDDVINNLFFKLALSKEPMFRRKSESVKQLIQLKQTDKLPPVPRRNPISLETGSTLLKCSASRKMTMMKPISKKPCSGLVRKMTFDTF